MDLRVSAVVGLSTMLCVTGVGSLIASRRATTASVLLAPKFPRIGAPEGRGPGPRRTAHWTGVIVATSVKLGPRGTARVTAIPFRVGDKVKAGDVVARLDDVSKPGTTTSGPPEGAIHAPFDGVIAARYCEPGTVLSPGMPILRLADEGTSILRIAIPPEDARFVGLGDTVRASTTAGDIHAVIERIAPGIDTSTRMVIAEARLSGDNAKNVADGDVARVFHSNDVAQR